MVIKVFVSIQMNGDGIAPHGVRLIHAAARSGCGKESLAKGEHKQTNLAASGILCDLIRRRILARHAT